MNQQPATPYSSWFELLADPRFSPSSKAIQDYLKLCEGLESPVPFHIWSFLSLMAALCGDKIALANGPMGRERLNLGIVLTGIPAIRKSSALTVMQKFAEGLPIQYGPTDTAGQRQGIMSAMMPRWQKDAIDDENQAIIPESTLEAMADLDTDSIMAKLKNPLERKASEIYFVSKELGRLIGSSTRELFDFFTDGMDGETFHYQLKNQVIRINKPLMNILGATTPTSLGTMLPRGGDSHGFLSRLIFVHASHMTRMVPIVKPWGEPELEIQKDLHDRIYQMLDTPHEEMGLSKAAIESYTDLYGYVPYLSDLRLAAYTGRRAKHLLKIAALLALLRESGSNTVIASDIRLAHGLLALTECNMDRAFYGLDTGVYSRLLCAITEIAEGSDDGCITLEQIQSHAGHVAPKHQLNELMDSLVSQGKIKPAIGSGNKWVMNADYAEMSASQIRMAFRAGGEGLPKADEFRTHVSKLKVVDTKKGAAG